MRNNIIKMIMISMLILFISILSSSVYADNESNGNDEYPRFIIKSVEAKEGDIVEVNLSVKSPKSVASGALVVEYNSNLQYIDYSNEGAYSLQNVSNYETGKISVVFVAQRGNIDADGKEVKICTLKFKVPEQANGNKTFDVSVRNVKDMCNNNGERIESYFTEKGTVNIANNQTIEKQKNTNNNVNIVIQTSLIIMWIVTAIILIIVISRIVKGSKK